MSHASAIPVEHGREVAIRPRRRIATHHAFSFYLSEQARSPDDDRCDDAVEAELSRHPGKLEGGYGGGSTGWCTLARRRGWAGNSPTTRASLTRAGERITTSKGPRSPERDALERQRLDEPPEFHMQAEIRVLGNSPLSAPARAGGEAKFLARPLGSILPSIENTISTATTTTATTAVAPRKSKIRPCPVCKKDVTANAFADHVKVHSLLTEEHGVKADRPCESCRLKNRECRIARVPGRNGLGTYRCRPCLQYHECCSYMKEVRGLSAAQGHPGTHPARAVEGRSGEAKLAPKPE
ncbi:hypothetical protein EDB81DRAFT_939583 [Dactylonectria macrodidyma]|uniref:Uncharacterized protein n=1 Tax=Dactylonectria macrodidyma TaxID=307937 RepID=A0A9P9FSZ3_9HYPO|nr:hypothetical protein EDB81DRAFT_939583 [Dactylonectria macrodidyma]